MSLLYWIRVMLKVNDIEKNGKKKAHPCRAAAMGNFWIRANQNLSVLGCQCVFSYNYKIQCNMDPSSLNNNCRSSDCDNVISVIITYIYCGCFYDKIHKKGFLASFFKCLLWRSRKKWWFTFIPASHKLVFKITAEYILSILNFQWFDC